MRIRTVGHRKRRCELCKCDSVYVKFGFHVCVWHYRVGEDGPPCPMCGVVTDYKWTYTSTGEATPRKVEMRQVKLSNMIFLNDSREMVLDIECVREPAPRGWPYGKRFSVIMIGVGQQVGTNYWITQWASDWERELMDAARPTLALAKKIYIEARGDFDSEVLAGQWVSARADMWGDKALWPAIDIRRKTENVRDVLKMQDIGRCVDRTNDISGKDVLKLWRRTLRGSLISIADLKQNRERVWKHNYLDVLETTHKIFQIEPTE